MITKPLLLWSALFFSAVLASSNNTTEVSPTEEAAAITCLKCYIQTTTRPGNGSETVLYTSHTDMLGAGTLINASQSLEMCPKVRCTKACVIATAQVVVAKDLAFPTARPFGANATTTPPEQGELETVDLEYRTCASPVFDMCASFAELRGDTCQQKYCTSDSCNEKLAKGGLADLVIIVVSAVVSLLVLAGILVLVVRYWLRSRSTNNYKEVASAERAEKKSFWRKSVKSAGPSRVKQAVQEIEDKDRRSKDLSVQNRPKSKTVDMELM